MTIKNTALALVAGAAAVAVAACGSVGGDDSSSGGGSKGSLTVGLVVPQSGVYAPLGVDMKAGWNLYLKDHDGELGGRAVKTVTVDEGETPETGVPAVQKLLQDPKVDVIVGIVNSATALGVQDAVKQSKKVVLVANAGANAIGKSNPYMWRTSFTNAQADYAIGKYAATLPQARKGAYAIAADYAAGDEHMAGFIKGFTEAGGKIVGKAKTPFGTTQDFQPYLSKIRNSGAGLTYAFYAGAEAVAFVKQYKAFGLKSSMPLVGSGFLTEGGVLKAQGAAASGIRTALSYATGLHNSANATFAPAYTRAAGQPPTVYAVQTWDAGLVLDRALQKGGDLSKALAGLGEIRDSPRGPWTFDGQTPKQRMYLRDVTLSGGKASNRLVESLGSVSPTP